MIQAAWADLRVVLQLAGVCVTVGVILAQIQILKRDVGGLQRSLHNGISEKLTKIAESVVRIETTCAERSGRIHGCEGRRHSDS